MESQGRRGGVAEEESIEAEIPVAALQHEGRTATAPHPLHDERSAERVGTRTRAVGGAHLHRLHSRRADCSATGESEENEAVTASRTVGGMARRCFKAARRSAGWGSEWESWARRGMMDTSSGRRRARHWTASSRSDTGQAVLRGASAAPSLRASLSLSLSLFLSLSRPQRTKREGGVPPYRRRAMKYCRSNGMTWASISSAVACRRQRSVSAGETVST